MNTRPPVITEAEIEKLVERLVSSGARITMQDPRVTNAQNWLLTTIGAAILALVYWGVNSINKLNENLVVVVTQNEYRDKWVGRIENHVEAVDSRVTALEKKVRP